LAEVGIESHGLIPFYFYLKVKILPKSLLHLGSGA
jgi:hypothetical protein